MNEPVFFDQDSQIGASTVFIIIPFSTNKASTVDYTCDDFVEWYTYGQKVVREDDYPCKLKEPTSESLLRQLLDKDHEIYSTSQFKERPFTRGLIERIGYRSKSLTGIKLKILVTYHNDGVGTVVLINLLPSMSAKAYLQVISELISWKNQSIDIDGFSTLQEYLFKIFSDKRVHRKTSPQISWGEEYPFFSFGGADRNIGSLPQFIEKNKAFIYALSHQDYIYGGWERIRNEKLDSLLDQDLSRRTDYAFYLTEFAMLEIDTERRHEFISKWAKIRNTTQENMRIKLLFERVQLLELLLTQRFILLDIETNIQQHEVSSKMPTHQLIRLNNKITYALSNYYYANAMTRQHVSGIEWVTYGQRRLHLDELVDHIKNRMELIESCQQMKNDFNSIRGNYVFQLISVILGSSAVVGAFDTLLQFPAFADSWFAENALWFKSIIYAVFLIGVIILTIRYSKDR